MRENLKEGNGSRWIDPLSVHTLHSVGKDETRLSSLLGCRRRGVRNALEVVNLNYLR